MSALVGRDAEHQAIVRALEADQPVLVLGEAGIGKTSLVRSATAAAGRRLHEGGGFATLADLPYLAIGRAIGRSIAGDPALVAAEVEEAVGPDVLFVDDLHWTDGSSRDVLELLLGRISVAIAAREGLSVGDGAIRRLMERGVAVVRVAGLDRTDALALAERLQPDGTPARLRRIVEAAGGNPLVIEELSATGSTSTSLNRAILAQVDGLPPDDRAALEVLAVAGRPLPAEASGAAGPRLVGRGLAVSAGDDLAVRHSLVSDAILTEVPEDRRREIHARLADIVTDPAERARHLAAAGRRLEAFELARATLAATTDPRRRADLLLLAAETSDDGDAEWRILAARQLKGLGRNGEAIRLLTVAPVEGPDVARARAAVTLAGALEHEGRSDEALAVIEAAHGLELQPSGPEAQALVLLECTVLVNRGRLGDALALAERAAAEAGPDADAVAIEENVAALRLYAGTSTDLDPLQRAIARAIEAGDGGTAASRAMNLYYMTLAFEGGAAGAANAIASADRIEAVGYHTRALELRAEAAQATIFAGQLRTTVLEVDAMLEEPLGLLSRQRLLYNRGLALGFLGRFEDAERTFAEAFETAVDTFDGKGAVLWCWSEATFWRGQAARALEQAEASLAYVAFNDAEFVLPSVARAWAELELGRELTPAALEVPFRCLAGAVPEVEGLAALQRGDLEAATTALDVAAETWRGYIEPRALICRWAAADARRRAGDTGAVGHLRSVLDAAVSMGFEPLAARVRRSLRLAGERPAAATPVERAGGLLTGRERDVLRLVELGLTNVEIARRMGLGRPTVARLLSNAMLKLGAESRGHAIVLASELV